MSSYRPNYDRHPAYDAPPPPPPSDLPPLPRGPPPPLPYGTLRGGDSYRPDFSFRPGNAAPQYPPAGPRQSDSYRPPENRRRRQGQPHSDSRNLNRSQHGRRQQQYGRVKVATSARPLLQQNDGGNSPEQMLGVANGAPKFMLLEDISDSEEEDMDLSESDREEGEAGDGIDEPHPERRALALSSDADASSVPKWSNPDPYTVLPPVDEVQRKKTDPVKAIRKAREHAEEKAAAERKAEARLAEENETREKAAGNDTAKGEALKQNQVVANDDFISFGMDDDNESVNDDTITDPGMNDDENLESIPFSHLQNLHHEGQHKAPGTDKAKMDVDALGPPPGLGPRSPSTPKQIVLDFGSLQSNPMNNGLIDLTEESDPSLGNRKRTHDDTIKGIRAPKSTVISAANPNGSLLPEWRPSPNTDGTPWLQRSNTITANAGFQLHKEICDFYDFVKPRKFEQDVREELLLRLEDTVRREIPYSSVRCFGSFAASLYLPNADMDVVVISDAYRSGGQGVICQTRNKLHRFGSFVEKAGLAQKGSVEVIVGAKVPLVKFVDRITALKVDISFENDTGIKANDTFSAWKQQYPAMPILVTVIKQFLQMRGLNEVQHGGIGGFSVTCLVTSMFQNMPRIQTGEVVPEENLGEMLLEFLDLYGNQLDTSRTGIRMNPPGYFDKRAYLRPGKKGNVYQASQGDRLSIMDPNKPENDISGGSRRISLIFERLGRAHSEILEAMKARSRRPSLLDWFLGGDYESFRLQRARLLDLYRGDEPDGAVHELKGNNVAIEAIRPEVSGPPIPNAQDMPKTTRPKKSTLVRQQEKARRLRQLYPEMTDIPDAVSNAQKQKLGAKFQARRDAASQNGARSGAQPAKKEATATAKKKESASKPNTSLKDKWPSKRSPDQERAYDLQRKFPKENVPLTLDKAAFKLLNNKFESRAAEVTNKQRAFSLQRKFPNENVPVALDKAAFKALNNQFESRAVEVSKQDALQPSSRPNTQPHQLPPRPKQETIQPSSRPNTQPHQLPPWLPLPGSEPRQGTRAGKQRQRQSQLADRMLPPSDSRRAEVARNLTGNSSNEPINLD